MTLLVAAILINECLGISTIKIGTIKDFHRNLLKFGFYFMEIPITNKSTIKLYMNEQCEASNDLDKLISIKLVTHTRITWTSKFFSISQKMFYKLIFFLQ